MRAARAQSFWEPLARWQPPLLVVRSPNAPLVDDAAWTRYRKLFPQASFHEFTDSPHDIFRPDRGRYPALVRSHVDAVERLPVAAAQTVRIRLGHTAMGGRSDS